MKELHKRSRNPKYKKKYKVTNWKEYEQSLCNRGSLTLWISPSVIKSWKPLSSKRRGRQQRFSDQGIETILTLRFIFHLPLSRTSTLLLGTLVWNYRYHHNHHKRNIHLHRHHSLLHLHQIACCIQNC